MQQEISDESIRALMSRWGRKGGQATSERKRAASRRNLAAARQRAATPTPESPAPVSGPRPLLLITNKEEGL